MTNPKHTDTSRIADLRFQVSEKMPINHSDLSGLFDRIEALTAENERIAEAGAKAVMNALWPILGGNHTEAELWYEINDAIRAALGDTQ